MGVRCDVLYCSSAVKKGTTTEVVVAHSCTCSIVNSKVYAFVYV